MTLQGEEKNEIGSKIVPRRVYGSHKYISIDVVPCKTGRVIS